MDNMYNIFCHKQDEMLFIDIVILINTMLILILCGIMYSVTCWTGPIKTAKDARDIERRTLPYHREHEPLVKGTYPPKKITLDMELIIYLLVIPPV